MQLQVIVLRRLYCGFYRLIQFLTASCVCVPPGGTLSETPWVTRASGTKFDLHLGMCLLVTRPHAHTSYRFNKVKAIFKSQVQEVITSVQTNQINRTHFPHSDLMYPHVLSRRVTKKITNCRLDDLSHHVLKHQRPLLKS